MKRNDVLVTTTSTLEGWKITKYLSPVAAHIVAGTNLFSDAFASFSDLFGGRSHTYQKQLQSINDAALYQLRQLALDAGANCVLAARIDHDEISGGGKSMFMVTASGTAVKAHSKNNKSEIASDEPQGRLGFEHLQLLMKKQQMLEKVEKSLFSLSAKDWDTVVENRWHEFLPYILQALRKEVNDTYMDNSQRFQKTMSELLKVLPFDHAQTFLFDTLESETDYKLQHALIRIIGELYILDYERVNTLLNSSEFEQQKLALQLIRYHKLYYTADDLNLIRTIIQNIVTNFPKRGQEKSKSKLLSSKTKSIWECECGNEQATEEKYCKQCGYDIYGFGEREYKPDDANVTLNQQLQVLENYFKAA